MRNRGKLKYIMPILPCNYVRNTNFVREPSRCHFIRPRSISCRAFRLVTSREHIPTLIWLGQESSDFASRAFRLSRVEGNVGRGDSFLNGDDRFGCGGVWVTVRPSVSRSPRATLGSSWRCRVVLEQRTDERFLIDRRVVLRITTFATTGEHDVRVQCARKKKRTRRLLFFFTLRPVHTYIPT